jgi:hypothetical protein
MGGFDEAFAIWYNDVDHAGTRLPDRVHPYAVL